MKSILIQIILFIICYSGYSQDIPDDMINFYPFNGNAIDESGSGNIGNVNGPVLTTDRCGNENSAYLFDGINDFISLDPSFITPQSSGTFTSWVYFNSVSSVQYLGCVGDLNSQDHYLSLIRFDPNYGKFTIFRRRPGLADIVVGSTPISSNQWYFVVMTSDGTEWCLYVNGLKEVLTVVSGQNSGDWANEVAGADNWLLGCIDIQEPHDPAFLNGKLDDVMIFDRAISSDEVRELYNNDCYSVNDVITDIDGNTYPTIEICGQIWMAENLKTTRYNDGISIPLITNSSDWIDRAIPGMCTYDFTTDEDFINQYGRLYNWYTVNTDKLCPTGYHVPSDDEWKQLEKCLCMSKSERDRMGPRGTTQGSQIAGNGPLWLNGELETSANFSEVDFDALPAGFISSQAIFWDFGEGARFWTSSEFDNSQAILRYLNHDESTLGRTISSKSHGRSIRCINSSALGNPDVSECFEVTLEGEPIVCQGDLNVIYEAVSDADITEYTWHYSGNGVTIAGDSNLVILNFSETATSGILSVNVEGEQIINRSALLNLNVTPLPDAAGNVFGESIVCRNQANLIYAVPEIDHSTQYHWVYSGTGVSMTGSSNEVHISFGNNASSGILSVWGINTCGTGEFSDFPIEVRICNDTIIPPTEFLSIPNSFSPNGDGINDTFYIKGLPGNSTLFIFDRNGKMLFESDNYDNSWNGNDLKDHPLESGTYWYIITIPGFSDSFKGFIYLKR